MPDPNFCFECSHCDCAERDQPTEKYLCRNGLPTDDDVNWQNDVVSGAKISSRKFPDYTTRVLREGEWPACSSIRSNTPQVCPGFSPRT